MDSVTTPFWNTVKNRYSSLLQDTGYFHSVLLSVALLAGALVINYFAALYALERASSSVTDIVLSNIPVFNVDGLFIWGPIIFWFIISMYLLSDPRKIPFTLKSIVLFILIRSLFVSLTHIGPFPDQLSMTHYDVQWMIRYLNLQPAFAFIFTSGSDLFFSAHTGLPFLMALTFWNDKNIRIFCLISSIFFAIIVLLGHFHYSIDVISAFFITFTISHLALHTFTSDKQRFESSYTQN